MAIPITGTPTATTLTMDTHIKRLDFLLPDFVRRSWVSDDARATWEPRFKRITHAWFDVEWRAVLAGVRACGVTIVSPETFIEKAGIWAAHGLNALPVEMQGLSSSSYASTGTQVELGKPFVYRVVVGTPASVIAFKAAWDNNDHHRIGELLGYPACCHDFFHDVWVEQGMVDTTWPMAMNTGGETAVSTNNPHTITLSGPPEANILWRWMGIRAVPHLPCSFTCAATVTLGQQIVQVGRDAGYAQEMDWLLQILSWPVEWSALHGIAEIKTPVLKVSTRSDATPHKYVVRRLGTAYPAKGAAGLAFPYHLNRAPRLTGSAAFQRGLDNPITDQSAQPAWLATDNGFNSILAMEQAHQPIAQLAAAVLADDGNVIDLGCGNGALLQKIQTAVPSIIPFGCDREATRIAHARQLHPPFTDNFVCADLFDPTAPIWSYRRHYKLALLMPGRLLEVDAEHAALLRQMLQQRCDHILVYAYGDWLTRYQNLRGLAAQAGLTLLNPDGNAPVGLAQIDAQTG